MPTYAYRCTACGFEFERVQRMSEDAIKECPECHKEQAQRQISGGNFILKGSGWYADLYSGSSNKKGGGGASASSSSTSTGTSTTTSTDSGSSSSAASTSTSTAPTPAASASAPSSSTPTAK